MRILLQINWEQASLIEKSILGTFILSLVGAVVWLAITYTNERKRNRDDNEKMATANIQILGELKEVVRNNSEAMRNNTEILNQIKGKL